MKGPVVHVSTPNYYFRGELLFFDDNRHFEAVFSAAKGPPSPARLLRNLHRGSRKRHEFFG